MTDVLLGIPTAPAACDDDTPAEDDALNQLVQDHLARTDAANNTATGTAPGATIAHADGSITEPADAVEDIPVRAIDVAMNAEIAALLKPPPVEEAPSEEPARLETVVGVGPRTADHTAAPAEATEPSAKVGSVDDMLAEAADAAWDELAPNAEDATIPVTSMETAPANALTVSAENSPADSVAGASEAPFAIATIEETIGVVEEVPGEVGTLPEAAAEENSNYDTFPARETVPEAKIAVPRRKSRFLTLCTDILLTVAQLLDMPFRGLPAEVKQYAGITGVVSAILAVAILMVVQFSHQK